MINADEIAGILKGQIANYKTGVNESQIGTVIEVGDNIARVYGLEAVQQSELVEFANGVQGIALNLEEDNVGVVIMGSDEGIKEGDKVRRTGRIASVPVGEVMLGRVPTMQPELSGDFALNACVIHPFDLSKAKIDATSPDVHGGLGETSVMLALVTCFLTENARWSAEAKCAGWPAQVCQSSSVAHPDIENDTEDNRSSHHCRRSMPPPQHSDEPGPTWTARAGSARRRPRADVVTFRRVGDRAGEKRAALAERRRRQRGESDAQRIRALDRRRGARDRGSAIGQMRSRQGCPEAGCSESRHPR